jgi:hypothetical protein
MIIIFALNVFTIGFWFWVCFMGGDETWCRQTKEFWKCGFYNWMTPRFCRMWMWMMLVQTIIADVLFVLHWTD